MGHSLPPVEKHCSDNQNLPLETVFCNVFFYSFLCCNSHFDDDISTLAVTKSMQKCNASH